MHVNDSVNLTNELREILEHSSKSAGQAVAGSVASVSRQMSPLEFVNFWKDIGVVAMTTVGPKGQPHSAPVHATLHGKTLSLVIYDNTIRRADLRENPRVSFTGWDGKGAVVILYGRAKEIEGSLRDARTTSEGTPRRVVEVQVEISRIYAMRAPQASS